MAVLALAAPAAAHGPTNPVASDYLARIGSVPPGLEAKVVDGDQRMWLRVPRTAAVIVVDYIGAPYLRFSAAGVAVNANSQMYYLNQTPIAVTPPAGLTRSTPPHWQSVSSGHTYEWHDGRLHALAAVTLAPGQSYVGQWRVQLSVNGLPAAITGGLYHRGAPSLVWLWPAVVVILCALAAWRLRDPELDHRLSRWLGAGLALLTILAAAARAFHGRPGLAALGVGEFAVIAFVAAWLAARCVRGLAGFVTFFATAFLALWQAIGLLPALFHGYVLVAVPAFVARVDDVLLLGGAVSLLTLSTGLTSATDEEFEDEPDPLDGVLESRP